MGRSRLSPASHTSAFLKPERLTHATVSGVGMLDLPGGTRAVFSLSSSNTTISGQSLVAFLYINGKLISMFELPATLLRDEWCTEESGSKDSPSGRESEAPESDHETELGSGEEGGDCESGDTVTELVPAESAEAEDMLAIDLGHETEEKATVPLPPIIAEATAASLCEAHTAGQLREMCIARGLVFRTTERKQVLAARLLMCAA